MKLLLINIVDNTPSNECTMILSILSTMLNEKKKLMMVSTTCRRKGHVENIDPGQILFKIIKLDLI